MMKMTAENLKPDFIKGEIFRREYDGIGNDLLTGGLGKSGLEGPAPVFENLTAEHLRTLAIYHNYRAMIDISRSGGYGILYGPNVGIDGLPSDNEGKIAGKEYLAYTDDGAGTLNVTMMVQIPDSFDPNQPRIIATATSGSRGIYGTVGTVGDWGLKRGFAVVITDKGTGTGIHDLDADTVNLITGEREHAQKAGDRSQFTSTTDQQFIRDNPHRIAFKHAHSGQNPQAYWGTHVLQAIRFAFYVLNLEENFGKRQSDGKIISTITRKNTLVIASGISNGGDACIRAAEQDTQNLIDAVVVSEPNICPEANPAVVIQQGNKEWRLPNHSRPLLDYITLLNIYQPCANNDANHCSFLAEKGLLKKAAVEDMAAESQTIINTCGILEEQNPIQAFHFPIIESIAVTYANAFGRFSVCDNLCGFSFAATHPETKAPVPLSEERADLMFAESAGLPPTPGGVDIINNGGKYDGASCLRRLVIGKDEIENPLIGEERTQHERIKQGISEIRASGKLKGLPLIIVHGRNDAILPPNHTSRAYVALNSLRDGTDTLLRYYEVKNAHHLDMLNKFSGFDSKYVPLLPYFFQSLDLMYDHLINGTCLPSSQVVRTIPRGIREDKTVPNITRDNVPSISRNPAEKDKIVAAGGKISIPE